MAQIQFKRGNGSKIEQKKELQLKPGQPLYNMDKNYLTIGDKNNKKYNAQPISVKELKGWYADNNSIIDTGNNLPDYYIRNEKENNINYLTTYFNRQNFRLKCTSGLTGNNVDIVQITNNGDPGDTALRVGSNNLIINSKYNTINGDTLTVNSSTTFSKQIEGTITNAVNVTTNINGNAISSIFESDGLTVKKAKNASIAEIANYADNDKSKGTIEERLNRKLYRHYFYMSATGVANLGFTCTFDLYSFSSTSILNPSENYPNGGGVGGTVDDPYDTYADNLAEYMNKNSISLVTSGGTLNNRGEGILPLYNLTSSTNIGGGYKLSVGYITKGATASSEVISTSILREYIRVIG